MFAEALIRGHMYILITLIYIYSHDPTSSLSDRFDIGINPFPVKLSISFHNKDMIGIVLHAPHRYNFYDVKNQRNVT